MFCSACGTKVPANAQFCFRCGARLAEVIAAAAETDEPPPLPSTSATTGSISVDGRTLPPLPPPVPTPAAAVTEPPPARGNPWLPGALVLVFSALWLVMSAEGNATLATNAGFWLGGMVVVSAIGAAVTGVLAIFPPLRRRFRGRWLNVFLWSSAIMFGLVVFSDAYT